MHFTEHFFDPQLTFYTPFLTENFDVDGHAQAATLLHEFAHLFSEAVDMTYLEARRPFSDLISPITSVAANIKREQEEFQREALSLDTPREELFSRWNRELQEWVSLDSIPGVKHVGKAILKVTGCQNMDEARTAFRSRANSDARIATILHTPTRSRI
ncbi:hypothetical protein [Pseudomonas sp. PCH199]|uniref:hypothetical protein n=1 Tax=unclassified Pseudomonas TaxID=196821 RepID=UPI0026A62299|nr:hypothetical protein [Pseudomonas sp. PCH199]